MAALTAAAAVARDVLQPSRAFRQQGYEDDQEGLTRDDAATSKGELKRRGIKRRAKSMTGVELQATSTGMDKTRGGVAGDVVDLSPRKRVRRSLAPGRSILKASHSAHSTLDYDSHSLYYTPSPTYGENINDENATEQYFTRNATTEFTEVVDENSDNNDEQDTLTRRAARAERRQSSRRVSFAPTAQMREFAKDGDATEEDPSISLSLAEQQQQPLPNNLLNLALQFQNPDLHSIESPKTRQSPSRRRSSTGGRSATGHRRRSSVANAEGLVESITRQQTRHAQNQDDIAVPSLEDSPFKFGSSAAGLMLGDTSAPLLADNTLQHEDATMDMSLASASKEGDTTRAFKAAFVFPRSSLAADESAMDMVTEETEVTSAFAAHTGLFGAHHAHEATSEPASETTDVPLEYAVPLGSEGIDEATIERQRLEKAKRGQAAFYSLPPTNVGSDMFRNVHSPQLGDEESHAGDEVSEMDMSIVADTRRVSNVFATAFGQPSHDEAAAAAEKSRTLGEKALAFLDGEDEDEYSMAERTTAEDLPQSMPAEEAIPSIYPSLPDAFISRNTRLSVVPEMNEDADISRYSSRSARHLVEEVDDDATQDMDISRLSTTSRRTSIAHPLPSLAPRSPAPVHTSAKSPARSPAIRSSYIVATASTSAAVRTSFGRSPSPVKSAQRRRESLARTHSVDSGIGESQISSAAAKDVFGTPSSSSIPTHHPVIPPPRSPSRTAAPPSRLPQPASRVPGPAVTQRPAQSPGRVLAPPLPKVVEGRKSLSSITPSKSLRAPTIASAAKDRRVREGDLLDLQGTPSRRQSTRDASQDAPKPTRVETVVLDHHDPLATSEVDMMPATTSVAADDIVEEDDKAMTLDAFLRLTDVHFMDILLSASQAGGAHKARKSLSASQFASGSAENGSGEATLADQLVASGSTLPAMEALRMMARELRDHLRNNSQQVDEIEDSVNDDTPALFLEYHKASDEERAMLDTQFKLIRTYCRLATRNEWYTFRSNVMDELVETILKRNEEGLQNDLSAIGNSQREVEAVLPDLRTRERQLRAELEREKAKQAELDAVDIEHVKELRVAIAEQSSSIDDFRRENEEAATHLERLALKRNELSKLANEHRTAIAKSAKSCDNTRFYTQSEMYRLIDELDLLQYLHSWHLVRFDAEYIELVHAGEVAVKLAMHGARSTMALVPSSSKDDTRNAITQFLFSSLEQQILTSSMHDPKTTVRNISRLWTNARAMRAELMLLSQRYPLSTMIHKDTSISPPSLIVTARVCSAASKAEFEIQFEITGEEIASSKLEMVSEHVGCTVKVTYGRVDSRELTYIVRDRVSRGGQRALLEACMEAEAKCM